MKTHTHHMAWSQALTMPRVPLLSPCLLSLPAAGERRGEGLGHAANTAFAGADSLLGLWWQAAVRSPFFWE